MRDVVIVTGPPCAGKSTFVAARAAPGDLVLDFDRLAVELGSPHPYDHPPAIRTAARTEIERRLSAAESGRVWVIRSAPHLNDRAALATRLGASRVVVLAVPAEIAKHRAHADARPAWTAHAIDRWWSAYRPSSTDTRPEEVPPVTAPDPISATGPGTGEQAAPAVAPESAPPAAPARPSTEDTSDSESLRAQLAEAQSFAARVPELEQRAADAENQLTRLRVTRAAGLDDSIADRLRGKDEAELTADATTFAELLKTLAAGASAAPPASAPATPAASAATAPGRRPVEALRPASAAPPAETAEDDPAAIARAVFGKPPTP
ncbi:hypothetical protein [Lentzea aerocolonigenes]|uniref:hypothetical protein n=1 Tax=Lentzea aerocolonigenes TaxID=68170 RepID=UPI0006985D8F|nr:hypothetical protein [Lentzea aerocolonigenes]